MAGRRVSRGLVALNVALALGLALVTLAPSADAQRAARARGDYTMVAGAINGSTSHAIYIVDGANQEMVALRWNESSKSLDGIGFRDLAADVTARPGR